MTLLQRSGKARWSEEPRSWAFAAAEARRGELPCAACRLARRGYDCRTPRCRAAQRLFGRPGRLTRTNPLSTFSSMAKVEIYTKAWCPYCTRAMKLLESKGVEPLEYDVTMGGAKKAEMVQRASGRMTMPQVFIDGMHIGGSDDLVALDARGGLDPLLKR